MNKLPNIPAHPQGETMKALCFTEYGGTDVLRVRTDIPKPAVSPNSQDILIQVHACSFNPIDKSRLSGQMALLLHEDYNTGILGYDIAGVIQEVGSNVTDFHVGDQVYARLDGMHWGAAAEYVICQPAELAKKPSNLTMSQAASIPLAGLTAFQALSKAKCAPGAKVLITGGAGGVGSLAIAMAKRVFGASHVYTTASPGKGTEICQKAGADRVIDYRSEQFDSVLAGENFDVVFDTTHESHKMGPVIKPGGAIKTIAGTPPIEVMEDWIGKENVPFVLRFMAFLLRDRKAMRVAAKAEASWEYVLLQPSGRDLKTLAQHIEKGDIVPVIDTEASSLEDYKVAVDKLWSGRAKGKCVIKVVP